MALKTLWNINIAKLENLTYLLRWVRYWNN